LHELGGATKRARLALDFADDLVERDDVKTDHTLTAWNMERDVAGDLVNLLAVRDEVRASQDLGCGEPFTSAEIVDDLAKQLEAYAGLAKLRGDAQSDDIAERVTTADPSAACRDRRGEKSCPIPFVEPGCGYARELGGFLAREVAREHRGWP